MVDSLSEEKRSGLINEVVERQPELVMELLQQQQQPDGEPSPLPPSTPWWCKCGKCIDTPEMSDQERLCCGCQPQNCVSEREVSIDMLVKYIDN